MMLYLGPDDGMLAPAGLAVVHVTLHTALRNVFGQLTEESILAKARLAHQFMSRLMRPGASRGASHRLSDARPRIGICSLNPHGGEGGLFGDEERTIIRPAVERGLAEGLRLEGPLPTDTLMVRARDGRFDAVVAMYHDQGHIALKLLGMHRAVNVTLGLPIIRTSVAHGTAFDIAWQRQAETGSLIEALRVASRLAAGRRKNDKCHSVLRTSHAAQSTKYGVRTGTCTLSPPSRRQPAGHAQAPRSCCRSRPDAARRCRRPCRGPRWCG